MSWVQRERAKAGLTKAKNAKIGQSAQTFSKAAIENLKGNLNKIDFSKINIKNIPTELQNVYSTYIQSGFEAAANKYGYQSISELISVCGTAIITG